MNRTFKVWSRYSGVQKETATVERALGATTLDKVIHLAHQYGWMFDLGYALTAQQGGPGDFAIVSPDASVRVSMVIGSKGQITWMNLTGEGYPKGGQLVPNKRYQAVVNLMVHNSPVPAMVEA